MALLGSNLVVEGASEFPMPLDISEADKAILGSIGLDLSTLSQRGDRLFISIPATSPQLKMTITQNEEYSEERFQLECNGLAIAVCLECPRGGPIFYTLPKNVKQSLAPIIPHHIHFIWLGDTSLPIQYALNILICLQSNPAYRINFWVNPEYFTSPEKACYKIYPLLAEHGVSFRSFLDLESGPEAKYKDLVDLSHELHLKKPVLSSDILRLLILLNEGGIYFDTDTLFRSSLPTIIRCRMNDSTGEPYALIIDENRPGPYESESTIVNSFLAGPPRTPELIALLQLIRENSAKAGVPAMLTWTKDDVLMNTGPNILFKLGGKAIIEGISTLQEGFEVYRKTFAYSRSHYPDLHSFKCHCFDASWYNAGKKNIEWRNEAKLYAAGTLFTWKKTPVESRSIDTLKQGLRFPPAYLDTDDLNPSSCTIM